MLCKTPLMNNTPVNSVRNICPWLSFACSNFSESICWKNKLFYGWRGWGELRELEGGGWYLRCSITWIQLHSQLFSLLPKPAHKVPQPHNVVAVVRHGETCTVRKTMQTQTQRCSGCGIVARATSLRICEVKNLQFANIWKKKKGLYPAAWEQGFCTSLLKCWTRLQSPECSAAPKT